MASEAGPILAVIDCAAEDADVVAEAVWLARAAHASVVLVHVARRVAAWTLGGAGALDLALRQTALEQRILSDLQAHADWVRAAGVAAEVEDVYFGDPSAEVAYAANRCRASAVVAARRRQRRFARLLGWRSRDVRLARLLSVPLVLMDATTSSRRGLQPTLELQPTPDERLLVSASTAPAAAEPKADELVLVSGAGTEPGVELEPQADERLLGSSPAERRVAEQTAAPSRRRRKRAA
jgi:Universal stress protein family